MNGRDVGMDMERSNKCWVRVAGRRGLHLATYTEELNPESAGVLVLQDAEGEVAAGRFAGATDQSSREEDLRLTIVCAYVVSDSGRPLAQVLGYQDSKPNAENLPGHEWGALGLPDGWMTRVSALDEQKASVLASDVRIAFASPGYLEYKTTPFQRVVPGDTVLVAGKPGTVIAIDRRKDIFTVQLADEDEPLRCTFEDIDTMETAT